MLRRHLLYPLSYGRGGLAQYAAGRGPYPVGVPNLSAEPFADILAANEAYAAAGVRSYPAGASRGLAVLTCMDSRIDPLAVLGLQLGEAKILRNAGGRVTEDVLAGLVPAVHLLGVRRIMVIAHTRCAMASGTPDEIHAAITAAGGPDTRALTLLASPDQQASVLADVQRLRSWPYLAGATVGGFCYDLDTGRLSQLC